MDLHESHGFIRYICRWQPCDSPLLLSYTLATHICTLALLKYFQASDLEELRKTSAFPISLFLSLSLLRSSPLSPTVWHHRFKSHLLQATTVLMNEGQLTRCCLEHFLSIFLLLLFLFSAPLSSEAVSDTSDHSGTSSLHSSLSLSPSCALLVECYLVCCVLLAGFCCAAGQSAGLVRGNWWMAHPEQYKASSSPLHWCVDAAQLAAQWVRTVYCCGFASRQMHMGAQHWKGHSIFFIVPLPVTASLVVFLFSFALPLPLSATVAV